KAASANNNEIPREPMASPEAALRAGCFISAITPDAIMGTAGISQRIWAMEDALSCGVNPKLSCISGSPLHPVHLVEIGSARVSMNRNYQPQPYHGFGRGYGNRKHRKHHAGEQLRMGTVAPEGDQVQVGRVEHQFNSDEH